MKKINKGTSIRGNDADNVSEKKDLTHPGLLGALAGIAPPTDPLDFVGLGLGASPRAKHLVRLGLLYEHLLAVDKRIAELARKPRKRGAPSKDISKDELRAAVIQSLQEGVGKSCRTQAALIELAGQVEDILESVGALPNPRLFSDPMVTMRSLENSVSRGLKSIESWED